MSFGQLEQESLLAIAAFDEGNSGQAITLIPDHLYDSYQREIFLTIQAFRKRFNTTPGTTHMLDLVESLKRKFPDKAKQYAQIYESMCLTYEDGINAPYVFSRAELFGRYSRLTNGIGLALKELQGRTEISEQSVLTAEKFITDAMQTNISVMDLGTSTHDPARMMRALDAPELSGFSTGIPELDAENCRPSRKRLTVIEGAYGSGKTFGLLEIAMSAAMYSGANVAYIPLEMSEDECCGRIVQNLFGVGQTAVKDRVVKFNKDDKGRLIDFDFETIDIPSIEASKPELAKDMPKLRRKPKIAIKEFPSDSLTIPMLKALLDSWASRDGFHPDVLLVDYYRLMKINNASRLREELGQLGTALHGLAQSRNIAVVTAAQLNRGGLEGQGTGGDVAEDISINHTADHVIIYNQTEAESKLKIARLFVDKSRTGSSKFEVLISQSYAKGAYAVDSALMHTDYSSVLEEATSDSA
jgi:replicative DNA helicase